MDSAALAEEAASVLGMSIAAKLGAGSSDQSLSKNASLIL